MSRDSSDSTTNLPIYASLVCLCCLTHFMTHLGPAHWESPAWWLAISVVTAAVATLWRFTVRRFFILLGLQAAHVLADAPFNPDHWLLLFFVNLVIAMSALDLWIHGRSLVEGDQLYRRFAPGARWIFLICYGYAALAKLNTHFLNVEASCATELAYIQLVVSPWLKNVSVPALAGWVTVVAECAVALLLIPRRSRRYGIVLGVVFHTILVASPAISVFDFTMTIYTMLFLFAGDDVGQRLREYRDRFRDQAPDLVPPLFRGAGYVVCLVGVFMITRSSLGYALYGSPRVSRLNWLVNMVLAAVAIGVTVKLLFGREADIHPKATMRPQLRWQFVVIFLALFNGACPYLGLKTQGSFTMFSNLQTEAGRWNHLLIPRAVRVFDFYQDDLVQLASIDDKRLQSDFVDKEYLVPRFEVQRAAMKNPNLAATVIRDGAEIQLDPVTVDSRLGEPLSWVAQKLLIFRPVTPDGSPYCGN